MSATTNPLMDEGYSPEPHSDTTARRAMAATHSGIQRPSPTTGHKHMYGDDVEAQAEGYGDDYDAEAAGLFQFKLATDDAPETGSGSVPDCRASLEPREVGKTAVAGTNLHN